MTMREIEVRHEIWTAITTGRDDKGQPIAKGRTTRLRNHYRRVKFKSSTLA